MLQVKDTLRATVHLSFDGRVFKEYHGGDAATRFANEVKILRHLEARGCGFVPRLLEADAEKLRIITTNCGGRVEHLDEERTKQVFAELEPYGVRHDDPDIRNITYRFSDGRFCIIDFEFATTTAAATLTWSGWTDIGKSRKNNEDAFLGLQFDAREVHRLGKHGSASTASADYAFAVCDGMGGAKAGEYASSIAVEKITKLLPNSFQQSATGIRAGYGDVLTRLYSEVHRALSYLGNSYDEVHGMETTMSLCWFTPGWMCFGHVGDSRIYHLPARENTIQQLSEDDTYVGWLFRSGQINEREARTHPRRNVLQKALGGSNQFVDPQVGAVSCETGDIFLICSDGVVDGLYDHQIIDLLREPTSAQTENGAAKRLVEEAVKNSGRDNTTALVIKIN